MAKVNPIPDGFSSVTPHLNVKGAAKAIDFYKKAFGATEISRMPMPGKPDVLMHAELRFFGAPVMLVDSSEAWGNKDPQSLGGTPVAIHLYVADCDAVFKKAVAAGCTSRMEPNDAFWGDRFAAIADPFGHHWSIATHVADPTPAEMQAAAKKMFGG
ncbi:MAG: VOC family protein [Parvularculaceae bacterium]